MTRKDIDYEELLEIVRFVEASAEITLFRLKHGDAEIEIQKGEVQGEALMSARSTTSRPSTPIRTEPAREAQAARLAPAKKEAVELNVGEGSSVVRSPMVGVFYQAPAPGADPFVKVGQQITADATLCIIEVMKLMNSISAGCAGTVERVLVENGDPVEFDQALFVIRTDTDSDARKASRA